jgi:hypothetical protein
MWGSVVTGPYPLEGTEGFPRHYPPATVPRPCNEAAGEGFAVMSGSSHGVTPVQGNFLPDKEFRYLRHCVTLH